MKKIFSQLVIALVCALLGFLLTYQFKLLNGNQQNEAANPQNQDILAEIDRLKKEKQELIEANNTLSVELKKLEEAAADEGSVEAEIKKSLDNTRMQLGLLDVKGPGIAINISPKSAIFDSNSVQTNREITEEEIVYLVNALWFARAEAISINDIRITPQTGIKTSGRYISIGSVGRIDPKNKIVIKVIGDKSMLKNAVDFGGTLEYGALKNYNTEAVTLGDIVINKTTQTPRNEFIKPIE